MIVESSIFFSEYYGAFIENFVASELRALGINNLFYWTSKRESEVDFIIQAADNIYPLEVKSGLNRNIKSLRNYADRYQPKLICRSSPRNFTKADNFIIIPLYASFLIVQDLVTKNLE